MKKALIVSLAVLTLAALCPQNLSAGVGFKGGLNFANFNYSGPPDAMADAWGVSKGPIVGVFFSLGVGPIAIQPEIYYSRRGAKIEEGADSLVYRGDYLEVPILVKMTLMPGPISPVIFAGPYGSLLLDAKSILTLGGETTTEDGKDYIKSSDYGLVFGGGLEFKLQIVKLIVEGRYTMGMVNIDKEALEYSYKNKGFSVLVGISF